MSLLIAALLLAGAADTPKAAKPAVPPAQKVRCKRVVETGSLVKAHKDCRTAAEWDEQRRQGRKNAEDMVAPGADISGPGG